MRVHQKLLTSSRPFDQVFGDGNGHLGVRGNGNGRGHPGLGGKQLKLAKKTRRAKPHMWHGLNRAACQAYGAALLIMKCGFTIEQAIACTGSHTNYIDAMRWIVESDDPALLRRVLYGRADIFDAAAQVRPLIEMRAAFKKLTSEQRIAWAVEENPNLMFEKVIVPASAMQKKTGITEPVVVAAE